MKFGGSSYTPVYTPNSDPWYDYELNNQLGDFISRLKCLPKQEVNYNWVPKPIFQNFTGDFVINVKDMYKEKPSFIWRINGKSSIQKYEAFDKEDKVLYQSIATYVDWNNENCNEFIPVNVRFNYSQRGNCVVEYLGPVRSDPKFIHYRCFEIYGQMLTNPSCTYKMSSYCLVHQMMLESSQFKAQKENFEVYLQTLISQALDPNFISEIVKEMDEYFLSHMNQIDDMATTRKHKLIEDKNWINVFIQSVQYYPCVNIVSSKSLKDGPCQLTDTITSSHQRSTQSNHKY
ncbi:Glutamine and serine-rich protein 1 [Nymphon striatum]|nr:Glutamine and serine-rich protein 1 [Nymphon striatum]